jgi:hypothetical protein
MARACSMNSSAIRFSSALQTERTASLPRSAASVSLAIEEFLDLIDNRRATSGGIDGGKSAAYHHDREPDLQVGHGCRAWLRQ